MLGIYPYGNAIILTDDLYTSYGGHTGTSTPNQRAAAYLIAEKQMTNHIGTFLLPTTVTGTYPLYNGHSVVTEHSYVHTIDSVKFVSSDCNCDLSYDAGCSISYESTYGHVFVFPQFGLCGCSNPIGPFAVELVYTAGLQSGSSYQSDMLLALTIGAEITLNEIIDPSANEGVGDIGIQDFTNQSYKETRVKLGRNAFGSSARAQKIANLVQQYRRRKVLSVG